MEKSQQHIIIEIQRITQSIRSQISIENGQDIVAFIGPPKSGKSTLINCLLRRPLDRIIDTNSEEANIATKFKGLGPIINNTESFIPQQYENCPGTPYSMVEFPGLGDMLGAELEISLALVYEKVLRSQETVRFLLVVPISMIKSNKPMEFFKLLNNLVTLCPNIQRSLCIVATKSDSTSITTCLNKAMTLKFSTATDNKEIVQIADVAKSVIKQILESGKCIDFKAPNKEGRKNFILPNIKEIVDLIKELEGLKIETQVPVSISEFSNMKIVELYKEIDLKYENEMRNIIQYSELAPGLESKIENLAKTMDNLKNSSDFFTFIKEMKPGYYDDLPLVGNLKKLIYMLMVMKKFQIRDYMYRVDEIYNEIKSLAHNYRRHLESQIRQPQTRNSLHNTEAFNKPAPVRRGLTFNYSRPPAITTTDRVSSGTSAYMNFRTKLDMFELNKATEQRLANEIKNISKYFEQYETTNRLSTSQLENLRYIKDNLKRSSNIEGFIKNVEESDFDNWPLVENLKESIRLQTIMKMNNIFGYWDKQDADSIVEKICKEIDFVVKKYTSNLSDNEMTNRFIIDEKLLRNPKADDKLGKKCNVM